MYEFQRLLFGNTASPFCSQYVLHTDAKTHALEFPEAASTVEESIYVNDVHMYMMYKSASYEHQQRMSLALSRSSSDQTTISARTETTTRPTTSVTTVESATFNPVQLGSGFFSGATIGSFNNCTFNIQLTSGQRCQQSNPDLKHPRIESNGQMQ